MEELEFRVDRCSPCLYHHAKSRVVVFRHGDDDITLGKRACVKDFAAKLGENLASMFAGHCVPRGISDMFPRSWCRIALRDGCQPRTPNEEISIWRRTQGMLPCWRGSWPLRAPASQP